MIPCWCRVLAAVLFILCVSLPGSVTAADRVLLLAQNAGTEITDLLVPFAVLSEAGVDAEIVAMQPGPVVLWPDLVLTGLRPVTDADPGSATWLLVPAVLKPDDSALVALIRDAAARGTSLAAICDGVTVLAHAGVLNGHEATGHFYSARTRNRAFPEVHWRNDRRFIYDRGILTSAGVSASAPAAVELARRIAGPGTADRVASHFGISSQPDHDARAFRFGPGDGWTAVRNTLAPQRHYRLAATPAMDEYALAFLVDALGRTSRVSMTLDVDTVAGFRTLRGLTLEASSTSRRPPRLRVLGGQGADTPTSFFLGAPDEAIHRIFSHVGASFGQDTARFVAKQLELPVDRTR